jgi:hypothetical protein
MSDTVKDIEDAIGQLNEKLSNAPVCAYVHSVEGLLGALGKLPEPNQILYGLKLNGLPVFESDFVPENEVFWKMPDGRYCRLDEDGNFVDVFERRETP